jgi:putative membrane protein
MAIIAAVFVALAALLHGYIFLMESVWWRRPATWRRFGVRSQADADTIRPMAYNQGFYNLFLGIGAAIGLVLYFSGADAEPPGRALVLFATGAMVLAAVVLTTTGRGYVRPALVQGTVPLIGFVLFLFS